MSRIGLEMPQWLPAPDFFIETKAHALRYYMNAGLIRVTALGTGEITALIKVETMANNGDLDLITGIVRLYREMEGAVASPAVERKPRRVTRRPGEGEAAE